MLPRVARLRRQPRVLDRDADREVIQALERVTGEPEHLVHRIVVEAADAGGARAGGFGLEIQHLADDAGFPEQVAVERRAEFVCRLASNSAIMPRLKKPSAAMS